MMRGKSKLALMCRALVWSRPTSCSMRPVVQWEAPARRWFQRAGQPYLHLHLWRGRFDQRPRVIALQAVLLYRRQSFHFRIRQIVAARLTILCHACSTDSLFLVPDSQISPRRLWQ